MKSCTRQASVSWLGAGGHTKGAITTQGLAPENAACVPGRAPKWARGTHPPELIAAAHAESFSMTLANELWKAGYPADQIDTTVTVTLENLAAGWTMTHIHLDVIAMAPEAAQCDFIDAAMRAKLNCPISRLSSANISMRATLKRRAA